MELLNIVKKVSDEIIISITLVKLDDEMKELLKAKADTPAFKRF